MKKRRKYQLKRERPLFITLILGDSDRSTSPVISRPVPRPEKKNQKKKNRFVAPVTLIVDILPTVEFDVKNDRGNISKSTLFGKIPTELGIAVKNWAENGDINAFVVFIL
mmetsp:Transcript_11747/g.14620  ORF Transcript_11747/g.14620 Transcript_11747/m.14620 type:complete len:110 (+) Transcript_11747:89-418(+)